MLNFNHVFKCLNSVLNKDDFLNCGPSFYELDSALATPYAALYKHMNDMSIYKGEELCSVEHEGKTRSNRVKCREVKLRMTVRNDYPIRLWNILSREAVEVPWLGTFRP